MEVTASNFRDAGRRRRSPRVSVALPLEYWKRNGVSSHAGVSCNLGKRSLLIYSIFEGLCISQELKVLVFFPNGYRLDSIKLIAVVTSKKAHSKADWKRYEYELEIIHISRMDREKLNLLLLNGMADHMFNAESDPDWNASAYRETIHATPIAGDESHEPGNYR